MNLHHLQLFLTVAEEGSVTAGAERAAVSQPAVSRAIAELESSLGIRLLDRGPKGVTPTAAGTVLLDYAGRLFALENEAEDAMADLRGLRTGRLSIGASTTIGDYLLPGAVAQFLLAHPQIELSLEVSNTESIEGGVFSGRYDVGYTEGTADNDRFSVGVLVEDELVVFVRPDHPLAKSGQASLDELARIPFVMREPGSGTRQIVEDCFRDSGFVPQVACSLGSTTAIKRAVAAGLGAGVVSARALVDEVRRDELAIVRTPITLSRHLHAVRLKWRRESAALRIFSATLARSLSETSG